MDEANDSYGAMREELETLRAWVADLDPISLAPQAQAIVSMAGGAAHDINNLMTAILGGVALMRESFGAQSVAEPQFSAISKAASSAAYMAQRMLAFTQGKHHQEQVNFNHIINRLFLAEEQELAPRIQIFRYIDADLSEVDGDYNLLTQMAIHLAVNALESIPDKGRVVFRTRNVQINEDFAPSNSHFTTGPYIVFSVEDNGSGMDEAAHSRIFDPQFTTKGTGRGGGMALVYSIVKNHRGYILVNSEPGVGTECAVYLPASTGGALNLPQRLSDLPVGTETILAVEDNAVLLEVTVKTLERLGYHVLSATNGREAITTVRKYKGVIDAVLLDMAMPVMGGAEALPYLKKMRQDMRVVVCTGLKVDTICKSLLSIGADEILQKPYRPSTLAHAIRQTLDRPASTETKPESDEQGDAAE